MVSILNLFGKSPFASLKSHMERVAKCVHLLHDLFDAMKAGDHKRVLALSADISKQEHQADLSKNEIRNHLRKHFYMPIDRSQVLEILTLQDSIADYAEDAGVLATYKAIRLPAELEEDFQLFLQKNIETFGTAMEVVAELHNLLESSFGGAEAQKVRTLVEEVAYKEHEADLCQRSLVIKLYELEDQISYGSFYLWQQIFSALSGISNASEKLANRIRMSLELK